MPVGVVAKTNTASAKINATSALPAMFDRYRGSIAEELLASISSHRGRQQNEDAQTFLDGMLHYHMGLADRQGNPIPVPVAQGKALRPTLCLFACEALNEGWDKALPAAAGLELIHNFSLIHDDIQDGDVERRHQATVWTLWGKHQALVAGNAMRSIADITALSLAERGVPVEKALRASYFLTTGYLEMTAGQCLDLAYENSLNIGLEDYLTMVSCKTAALIRSGMEIGALIASDEEKAIQAFGRAGGFLGLAFQIRDDVLGIWGDESSTGKAVGNDIRRKKKSLPIVYAMGAVEGPLRQRLVDIYGKETLDEQDVADVLTVLEELQVPQYAQDLTREKASLALDEVRRVPLAPWAQQEIEELVEFITARQY